MQPGCYPFLYIIDTESPIVNLLALSEPYTAREPTLPDSKIDGTHFRMDGIDFQSRASPVALTFRHDSLEWVYVVSLGVFYTVVEGSSALPEAGPERPTLKLHVLVSTHACTHGAASRGFP